MWHKGVGISYEADEKHARTILEKTGARNLKVVSMPVVKEAAEPERNKEKDVAASKVEGRLGQKSKPEELYLLSSSDATAYRGLAATSNYLAADRGYLAYAAKECARQMAAPTKQSWERMVRDGRYLKGRLRLQTWYAYQEDPRIVATYSDTDWAGCRRTRRSTTGGFAAYGKHPLKTWCRTPATVALSSANAELYGLVRASAEHIGIMSMLRDLGAEVEGQVFGDAGAALAIIARKGMLVR